MYVHQRETSWRLTGPDGGLKTTAPGTRTSGGTPGKSFGSGFRSATVTYPVSRTNRANCSFVTGVLSIQKPSSSTGWIGRASPNGP
jgi:hypothetical protein